MGDEIYEICVGSIFCKSENSAAKDKVGSLRAWFCVCLKSTTGIIEAVFFLANVYLVY